MVEDLEARVERLEQVAAHHTVLLNRILGLRERANSNLETDPDLALHDARTAAEAICKHIYSEASFKKGGKPVGQMVLQELAQKLRHEKAVPRFIDVALSNIQQYGNFGSHDQWTESGFITPDFAKSCLHSLSTVVKWYSEHYLQGMVDDQAQDAQPESHDTKNAIEARQPHDGGETTVSGESADQAQPPNEAVPASIQAQGLEPLRHAGIHISCPHCHQRFYTEEHLEEDDWVEISCQSCGRDFTCDPEGGLYGTTLSCPQCETSFYTEALDADECGEVTCPAPGCGQVFNVDEQEPVGIYVTCPFCWEDFYDEGFGGRPACFHCEEEFTTDGNGKATGGHVECPECGEKWWEDNEEEEYGLFPQHCSACGRRFHVEIKPPNRRGQGDGT